jgi:hypothetical protein
LTRHVKVEKKRVEALETVLDGFGSEKKDEQERGVAQSRFSDMESAPRLDTAQKAVPSVS